MSGNDNAGRVPSSGATVLHSSARTRIFRLQVADGSSIVCKEPLGPDAYDRLRHERHVLARLDGVERVPQLSSASHPANVIALREHGGVPLSQVLLHERLSVAAILDLGIAVSRILADVHARGVVHCDVNPGNILLTGPERTPFLIDFHLASLPAEPAGALHRHEIAGTLAYLSPEQAGRSGRAVDHRADLYALGATLYELAVGHPPFQHKDVLQLVHDQLTRVPPRPADLEPTVPAALSDVIMRLLEKEPDHRYQSAEGLVHDLARIAEQMRAGLQPDFPLGRRDFPMRLAAPARLIGRDAETAALFAAFEDAMTGDTRGVLLSGAAGVGKTKLVMQLRVPTALLGGYVVAARFDPMRQGREADAMREVIATLGRLLLAEPEDELLRLRTRLLDRLGDNAALVAGISPEFATLLGIAPEALSAFAANASARVVTATADLLRSVVSPQRPLVLALGDVQWASPMSLAVLNFIMLEPGLRGLLVVVAWRDEELAASHPLHPLLESWAHHGAVPLALGNLSVHDVATLLADMLRVPAADVLALATALDAHTGGNPDDTIELVNALRRGGVLRIDDTGWTWDPDALRRYVGPGGVTDLLRARIDRLPAATRAVVDVLACLGGAVSPSLLASAAGMAPAALEVPLAPALEDGLLVMDAGVDGTPVVGFRHDRVRQTVHDAMDTAQRDALHLAVARRLDARGDAIVMASAQYLSVATTLGHEERGRVIALFHQAAGLTRLGNDPACEQLLQKAAELLGTPSDDAGRALAIELGAMRHATLLRLGRVDEADALFGVIEASGAAPLALVPAAAMQMTSLVVRQRARDAFDLGTRLLEGLGHPLERGQPQQEIDSELAALADWVQRETGSDPLSYPEVRDARIRGISTLLESCAPAAFLIDYELVARILLATWRLWRAHGVCAPMITPLSYAGIVSMQRRGDYRLGYTMAHFLLGLTAARGYALEGARVRSIFTVSYAHWSEPLEESLAQARLAHDALKRAGDLAPSCLPLISAVYSIFETAPTLSATEAEANTALGLARRVNNLLAGYFFNRVLAVAHALQGDEALSPDAETGAFSPLSRCHWHTTQALWSQLMGDLDRLDAHSAVACATLDAVYGVYSVALCMVLRAAALAQRAQACRDEERPALLTSFAAWRDKLALRAADAPANFGHLVTWLDAERAWAEGDYPLASRRFDDALGSMENRQRPWHRALITERAALFYLAHGLRRVGRNLMVEARSHYHAWGAAAKVLQLERNHPFLQDAPDAAGTEPERRDSVSTDRLHMLALLRASQALSSETSLARLQARVAEVLGAMTGATQVLMALPQDSGGWMLAGSAGPDTAALPVEEAAAAGLLPLSAFRYVERTGTALVVEDATRDDRFARDPYLAGMAQCSLLLLPILNQGTLRAMLMLENRQRRGAFANDRLEAVQLIGAQLAVSVDNAMLYASLERKVTERTRALEQANRELAALSVTDALTGLANRRRFDQVLDAEWLRALRPQTPLGAAMIDVDQFKLYNDHYGHQQGDACLRMVAEALARSVRHGVDVVARYGGEEFAIILPGADLHETLLVAERARAAVEALHSPHEPSIHGVVTVSIGIASLVPDRDSVPAGLFAAADAALYRAKQSGRNLVAAP